MKGEFYKMEYEAWDEGTEAVELTLEEEGAYLRICHQMYRRKGSLVNSPATVARVLRCHPNKAAKLLKRLIDTDKIRVDDEGMLFNKRVREEIAERAASNKRLSANGKAGGQALKEKYQKLAKQEAEKPQPLPSPPSTEKTNEPDNEPTQSDDRYAFESGCIKLNARDLNGWKRSFQYIDVESVLRRRSEWINRESENGKKWFYLCQSVLGKANDEAHAEKMRIKTEAEARAANPKAFKPSLV